MNGLQFPAIPGTMPAGVPQQPPGGPMPDVVQPTPPGPPPGLGAALPAIGAPPMGGMAAPPQPLGPADMQYQAITQEDGSVLLHMMKPDGALGPIVKIVPAPKNPMAQTAGQPGAAPAR
jgi:hypothetical protein